jgi:polyisoprenyl-phosphate glycosyltransferase
MYKISIIIPCYFNEKNIGPTTSKLLEVEKMFDDAIFEFVMIDDGSKDTTWQTLKQFKNDKKSNVIILKLAGNVGSYNAIQAGMACATGDCNVVISADLQDPPELIHSMFQHWKKGIKFVVAHRLERNESFFSKLLSNTFHKLIKNYALPNIPKGGFDFVLFDKQLCIEAVKINENNAHSIYLLAWMNYEMVCIPYERKLREIGTSKWTLKKKIKLFIDSFVGFSYAPIKFISGIGFVLGLVALIYAGAILYQKFVGEIPIEGWSSLMLIILFVSSFQMIALGIIGEYVWRTLDAARKRPNYIVEEKIDF